MACFNSREKFSIWFQLNEIKLIESNYNFVLSAVFFVFESYLQKSVIQGWFKVKPLSLKFFLIQFEVRRQEL